MDIDIPCLPYDGVWLTADFADIDNDGVEEVIVQVDHNTTMGDKWVSVFDIKDGVPALELLIYSHLRLNGAFFRRGIQTTNGVSY